MNVDDITQELEHIILNLEDRITELEAQRARLRRAVSILNSEVGSAGFYEDPMDAPTYRSEQAGRALRGILHDGDMTSH